LSDFEKERNHCIIQSELPIDRLPQLTRAHVVSIVTVTYHHLYAAYQFISLLYNSLLCCSTTDSKA